jgi:lipopolysaccharide export system permease protein
VGFVFSLLLLGLNEFWLQPAGEMTERILNRHGAKARSATEGKWQESVSFHNERDNRYWHIKAFNPTTFEMIKPQVEWQLADRSRGQLFADRAIWTNQGWRFFNVQQVWHATGQKMQTNELSMTEFSETPQQIKSEIKLNNLTAIAAAKKAQVSVRDILDYKKLHPQMDARTRALVDTQLQGRLAAPWTCLVVVVIALPFGAVAGRRNVFVGVAASIFICFAYFILMRCGLALGTGNQVSPWVAAWFPNLFFGGAGIWVSHRLR